MTIKNNLLYLKVKEALIADIKQLKPNDRLPSRTELVKKYKVTRTTIDRAISELIGEGYLYAKDGSGTYVSSSSGQDLDAKAHNHNVVSWGVILPDITRDTYPGILRGVEDVANRFGINVIICNTDNNPHKQSAYLYKQIETGVNGLVIVPAITGVTDLTPFKKLQSEGIPFVFLNRGINGIDAPKVTSNNFYGGYLATRHLIQMGYRRIAFVSRPLYSSSSERYQGYLGALTEAGIEPDENLVFYEDSFEIERPGYESTKKILSHNPDGIFAFNDVIAQGAYDAIVEAGLKVGEDIGLVGYDNTHLCERLPVKLTSIKFKTYEIGFKAAELLLRISNGETISQNMNIILQPELVVRESSQRKSCS